MTSDERAVIMTTCQRDWGWLPEPVGASIQCLPLEEAKALFLARFAECEGIAA